MIVTGVGTRTPPFDDPDLNACMRVFCRWATSHGALLRSGSAIGMDTWFERLWNANKEIFIPQDAYKPDPKSWVRRYHGQNGAIAHDDAYELQQAEKIAKRIHPNWRAMGKMGKALHTRNVFQVLGPHLDLPSDIIVYYAKFDAEGKEVSGGTRTAVMLAREYGIPEFNLILPDDMDRLLDFMDLYDKTQQH